MKPKNILVFGATGQIGRNLVRKLTKSNFKVTAVTRNLHQRGYILKTQANPGYIDIVETNIFDTNKLEELVSNCDVCINLIGILYEKGINTFKNIHTNFPSILSDLCLRKNVEQFIHVSALGIESAIKSKYAKSKLDGENEIKKNYQKALILRPSLIYSVDDNFTTLFMSLINIMPFFPLYYNGKTKFSPIHCSDMTEIISAMVERNINSQVIECIGPEQLSFKNIINNLLDSINKKRLLFPVPLFIGKFMAFLFEFLPKPLLTRDQIILLKHDNIASGKYKTNFDLNIPTKLIFRNEVNKYSFMWREGGQYSKFNS